MFVPELSWWNAVIVLGLYVAFVILRIFYRITLHPLAKFPGPFLASITHKYEWYYDGYQTGQYTAQIARMHEIYGTLDAHELG